MLSSRIRAASRRRAAIASLLVAAALALGACGGDDDSTTTVTDTSATTDTTDTTTGEPSDLRAAFDQALRDNLTQQQGLTEAQADCVLDDLAENLSDEQIQDVVSGETPQAVTEAAFNAGLKCAGAE